MSGGWGWEGKQRESKNLGFSTFLYGLPNNRSYFKAMALPFSLSEVSGPLISEPVAVVGFLLNRRMGLTYLCSARLVITHPSVFHLPEFC